MGIIFRLSHDAKTVKPLDHHLSAKQAKRALGTRRTVVGQAQLKAAESTRHSMTGGYASGASHEGLAKVTLASKLNELLDQNGLSQSAAAQLLGMSQPKVSAIRNYKLRGISLERLMQALLALNQQVEITVKPGETSGCGSIRVAV